jgi:hypothetical protein
MSGKLAPLAAPLLAVLAVVSLIGGAWMITPFLALLALGLFAATGALMLEAHRATADRRKREGR